MKKGIIAILLVLGLLAAMLGGTVATVSAAGTLTATVTLSTAPGQMTIGGTGWVPGVDVNIFIDKQDVAHQVAIVKPDATGKFLVTLTLGATTIGPHTAIAKQNGTTVNAPFTLTRVSQVDDRVYNAVDNIEQMLKDPVYGLEEIKNEVRDIGNTTDEISADVDNIENMLNSGYSGLSAIRRLVGWTERDVDQIKDAVFNSTYGLPEIKTEVSNIQGMVGNSTYGLESIHTDLASLDSYVRSDITGYVDEIEAMLKDTGYGLAEMKAEVSGIAGNTTQILSVLTNGTYGLEEIKTEVSNIESVVEQVALFNTTSGYEDLISIPEGWHQSVAGGDYAQVRHVSLTLYLGNMTTHDADWDEVSVGLAFTGNAGYTEQTIASLTANGVYMYEFDASTWWVDVYVDDGDVLIGWNAAITWKQAII